MVGSQFVILYSAATGDFILPENPIRGSRPIRSPQPIERRIADALRIRTNTIAGRPNVGNLALEFVHSGRHLPADILRAYVLRTLQSFLPDVRFKVAVSDTIDASGFQHIAVSYEVP